MFCWSSEARKMMVFSFHMVKMLKQQGKMMQAKKQIHMAQTAAECSLCNRTKATLSLKCYEKDTLLLKLSVCCCFIVCKNNFCKHANIV